jgi:hypothetical protein
MFVHHYWVGCSVDGCSVQVKGTGGGDIGGVREKLSERTKVSSDMYTGTNSTVNVLPISSTFHLDT